MKLDISRVVNEMIHYNGADARRINHAMKVYGFAGTIGKLEDLNEDEQHILETAAVLHDIGIKTSEEKYGSASGKYQQIEGPQIAKLILSKLGFTDGIVDRICWLIAHHHTYHLTDDRDYQILIEADFIVNIFEGNMDENQVATIRKNIFITKTGIEILDTLYL